MGQLKFSVSTQWSVVESLETTEVLIARDVDLARHRVFWRQMSFQPRADKVIEATPQPYARDPLYDSKRKEFLYFDGGGISAIPRSAAKGRRLCQIDLSSIIVEGIWLTPTCEALYFLERRTESYSMPDQVAENGQVIHVRRQRPRESVLIRLDLDTLVRSQVASLGDQPISAAIDWGSRRLLASIGDRLVQIDLGTGQSKVLHELGAHFDMTLSPRGSIVIWNWQGSRIEDISPEGVRSGLVENGRYPAFSPDGSFMAFLKNANELWSRDMRGNIAMIASYPPSESVLVDVPSWCPCSRHVAVNLAHADSNSTDMVFLVADVGARKLVAIEHGGGTLSGGRIWLSTQERWL